ncbi:MAG: hypothetical protein O7D91_19075 [Planctomycetota bacterium]|nr:hypothetical protein [Planctomycetota bacterium]
MWKRMLVEAVVIAVQTVILIGLCATIGVTGSDRKAKAESGRPLGLDGSTMTAVGAFIEMLLMSGPPTDVDPVPAILEGWQKCGTSDSACLEQSH